MSKLSEETKKVIMSEVFKSDDGVSEIPDPALQKGPHDTKLDKYQQGDGSTKDQKNKKNTTKDGKQYPMKKVSETADDTEENFVEKEDGMISEEEFNNLDDNEQDNWYDVGISAEHIDLTEDLGALFSSSKDLSEEFKSKTQTIIEAAVVSVANDALNEALDNLAEDYEDEKKRFFSGVVRKIDEYLNIVVENWLEQNEENLIRNSRVEIAESFLDGLKKLYVEHYIEIPDEHVNVVDELIERADEQNEAIDDSYAKLVEVMEENISLKKLLMISEESADLTDLQVEKFISLSEGVDYDGDDDKFGEQIREIKEAYFNGDENSQTRSFEKDGNEPITLSEETENHNVDPEVRQISKEISSLFGKK